MTERRDERVNELCRCHHMKSRHNGLNGHGSCKICACGQYTFAGWLYKQVLLLRDGDEVLSELIRNLLLRDLDPIVFLVGVDILKTTQLVDITAEVQYAYVRN